MTDQYPAGSPEWWLERIHADLSSLRPAFETLDRYYTGEHPLRFSSSKYRASFRKYLANLSDNWCGVVVDAVEERLNIQGFRINSDPAGVPEGVEEASSPGDQEAWAIWQRNNMDAGSEMAHTEAFINGYSNILVWGDKDGKAVITPEHPSQTMVACTPGSLWDRAAAVKEWLDDWTGYVMATVYLPDGLYKFISMDQVPTNGTIPTNIKWAPREVVGEPWPLPNPLGVVPMIPLENKARLLDRCTSEIQSVIPLQDAVNKLVADMLVASEFQAFRQRWATGLEIPVDPKTNQPIEPFKAAVDRLWLSESPDTHFGEFEQADLRVFTAAIETLVQHIATQSRTPPHYFYLSGQFPSGESIKSAETGLVAKARRRMTHFSDPWEEALRLAFSVEDNPRANATSSETIWSDPESRSEAEHTDSMVKLRALEVPYEILWERWGFSPQEIDRMRGMRAGELALALTVGPGGGGLVPPGLPSNPQTQPPTDPSLNGGVVSGT